MPKSKPKPSRKPEPAAQVAGRKREQRRLNRAHLTAHGWLSDAEAFVTAWRAGKITVTFEKKVEER